MYFHPVTIVGIDNSYQGTAASASGFGSSLTAYAVDPAMPQGQKQYKISGPNGVPTLIGTAQTVLPAMTVFENVKSA